MAGGGIAAAEGPPVLMRCFRCLAFGLAGLCAISCGLFALWMAVACGSDKGSPDLAAEWKAELSQYSSPEEAQAKNRRIIVVRFQDGGWVFGRCQNSHAIWKRGGGTVVVKDSRGQVRAFFGHVCGDQNLGAEWELWSLDGYYRQTLDPHVGGFAEHHFQ